MRRLRGRPAGRGAQTLNARRGNGGSRREHCERDAASACGRLLMEGVEGGGVGVVVSADRRDGAP